jgi:hypothetical protein
MDEFESKIICALNSNGTQTSEDFAALLDELGAAVIVAEDAAKLEKERSLDPSITPDPVAARQAMEDAAFKVGRLQTLLPRLQRRYRIVLAEEQEATAREQAAPLIAERDLLAAEFMATYTECAGAICELYQRMADNSTQLNRLRHSLPDYVPLDLRDSELVARNLNGFSRDYPSVLKTTVLPNLDGSRLWPPHSPGLSIFAQPVPYNPRHSPDWGRHLEQEQRQQEIDDEAAAKQRADDARERQRESGGPVWWEGERR